ncbi:hypothetical protein MYU51_015199 [Penicillium brevicompactum]
MITIFLRGGTEAPYLDLRLRLETRDAKYGSHDSILIWPWSHSLGATENRRNISSETVTQGSFNTQRSGSLEETYLERTPPPPAESPRSEFTGSTTESVSPGEKRKKIPNTSQ